MVTEEYDVAFVGGGLASTMLLNRLRPVSPGRVAVIEPFPPLERPPVHWSYWSHQETPYNRLAIGAWRRARVAETPAEAITPFTLRLVRSTDVFAHINAGLDSTSIEWLRTSARSITRREDDLYEIATDAGTVHARWVFDSVCEIPLTFPASRRPQAVLSGTGIRVEADRPVFDPTTATLFDPLDEQSFAYLLPLSPVEALLESASFGPGPMKADQDPLLRYLRVLYTEALIKTSHVEYGVIPLGFAPSQTAGPRHILIGAKRGLVKPSTGYGIVRIAQESEYLARLWRQRRSLRRVDRHPGTGGC